MPVERVNGPFEVTDLKGSAGVPILTMDYKDVAGSFVIVTVNETVNIRVPPVPLDSSFLAFGAEISIWGQAQGFWDLLKVQLVRRLSGPMRYAIPVDEPYNLLEIRARCMAGGSPNDPRVSSTSTTVGGDPPAFKCPVMVFVQPSFKGAR